MISAIALGPRLFTLFASRLFAGLGLIRRVGIVIKSRNRTVCAGVEFWTLLGLSAEDLLLEPGYSRQGFLKLVSQLGDLGLLTANDLFEALSLVLESRFPFGSTGMLCPPVVCLPAELDCQAAILILSYKPLFQ